VTGAERVRDLVDAAGIARSLQGTCLLVLSGMSPIFDEEPKYNDLRVLFLVELRNKNEGQNDFNEARGCSAMTWSYVFDG
jgi:hypothetical protein